MIDALLATAAARWPARIFVVAGARRWTFAELYAWARGGATALAARGVRPGDRVALMARNSGEFVAAWFGCALAGATVVPIPTVSAPPEVAHRLGHARCRLALADDDHSAVVRAGGADWARPGDWAADAAAPLPAVDDAAAAMILYTSGTTGVAKAAAFSRASLATHTRNVAATVGLGVDDVILGALPLTHSFGCRMVMLLAAATGARVVLQERFDAAGALALIAAEGVTFWPAVPTMLAAACALGDGALPTTSLRWVLSAGAPLPDALCRRAEARLGCAVRQGYGLTEASFSTIDAPPLPRAIGSVGHPVAGVQLRSGADGELEVRGPHVMLGYVDDDAASAAAVDADGWLRTGDVGRVDVDGRLWIVDRKKDLIIRGGNNVYPSEVEAALAAHPGVAEVAVVGRPDDYFGEEVVAVIVARPGAALEAAALATFVQGRVAATKVPREWAFVPSLPQGPSNKVLKRALRQQLADGTLVTTRPR
jgi:long-chain acyl-CoA synthetase